MINYKNLTSFINLECLSIGRHPKLISFKGCLDKFVNLKELDIGHYHYDVESIDFIYGPNFEIIDQMKKLEVVTLRRPAKKKFVNIQEIQERYSHVRFRWVLQTSFETYVYEGPFYDNMMSGKGKLWYDDGDIYEGEFKNDKREGNGTLLSLCDEWQRYEGEFKNNKKEGKGSWFAEGHSYVGDWRDDCEDGLGVYTWPGGMRYEGQFKNDESQGQGVMTWPNNDRFEGDWRDDESCTGIMYYSKGKRYAGQFINAKREGRGMTIYPNGNRYEGRYENDERVGEGVFYYLNGEKVEGDESKFELNDEDGTIQLL